MAILGHGWEKVVLNLEIEVSHPPVDKPVIDAVSSVIGRVVDPRRMLVGSHDIAVRVTDGEVSSESVACSERGARPERTADVQKYGSGASGRPAVGRD